MKINADQMSYDQMNRLIVESSEDIEIVNCLGQRFIGAGKQSNEIKITGTPGNALGAYLDGARIIVHGNVQDAVGDTMNEGRIVVHGNAGDALGYAMRGGEIFIEGYAGYRTGIHMKQYKEKKPVIVIGENVGSFAGEYLAGGIIVILNQNPKEGETPVGNFTGTGMHGGKIYVCADAFPYNLPQQVSVEVAEDISEIVPYLETYAALFDTDAAKLRSSKFYCLTPNAKNPYKKMYVAN